MKIRQEQMQILARSAYRDFEERLTRHLKRYFPDRIEAMGADDLRAFIGRCVEDAKKYELRSEQSVAYFSHLPLLLGDDFETSRRCRFAPAILRAKAGAPDERVKIAMLLAHQLKAKGMIGVEEGRIMRRDRHV